MKVLSRFLCPRQISFLLDMKIYNDCPLIEQFIFEF